MIGSITGKMGIVEETFAIIETQGGVGYKVFMTQNDLSSTQTEVAVSLFTHLAVRETALDLYGFLDKREMKFFELLITVSGIGPKTALNVLNVAPYQIVQSAIYNKDASPLTRVSGIGKKVAEKIVNELHGKVEQSDENISSDDIDVLDGLSALGFSERDAREALKKIEDKSLSVQDKIKKALNLLQ